MNSQVTMYVYRLIQRYEETFLYTEGHERAQEFNKDIG